MCLSGSLCVCASGSLYAGGSLYVIGSLCAVPPGASSHGASELQTLHVALLYCVECQAGSKRSACPGSPNAVLESGEGSSTPQNAALANTLCQAP